MLLAPPLSADHALPSHLATPLTATPPAVLMPPPTYRSVPADDIASTLPFIPVLSADHVPVVVLHLAMRLTGRAPARVNDPPTYTSVPIVAIALTSPSAKPVPRADHAVPFHFAMRFVLATPPASEPVKLPPLSTS